MSKVIKHEHLPNTRDFETDNGVNINSNIQNGKTKLFRNTKDAEEDALQSRSYSYPVFEFGRTNGYYAVPY